MPMTVTRFESTPNPNALKCIVEPSPGPVPRSYRDQSGAEAEQDALALAIFGIPGISSMLIHEAFITVVRVPGVDWKPIRAALRAVLQEQA